MLDATSLQRPIAFLSWTGTSSGIRQTRQAFPQTGKHSSTPAEIRLRRYLHGDWTPTGSMTGPTLCLTQPLSQRVARIPWTLLIMDGSVHLPTTLHPRTTYYMPTASP